MSNQNPLCTKSYSFAKEVVTTCHEIAKLKNEYVLTRQLIRSGTSIGANIEEAQQSQSRKDFAAKLSISLKEAYESRYWIRLLGDIDFMPKDKTQKLLKDLDEVAALLSASIGTARKNIALKY